MSSLLQASHVIMLENPDAVEALIACHADIQRLRTALLISRQ